MLTTYSSIIKIDFSFMNNIYYFKFKIIISKMSSNDEDKYVPFFGEFDKNFPRLISPLFTVGLDGRDFSLNIGETFRGSQLPINQFQGMIKNKIPGSSNSFRIGFYKYPTIKTLPDTATLKQRFQSMGNAFRGTIGICTEIDNVEFGAGVVVAPTNITDKSVTINETGFNVSRRTSESSIDLQILENGFSADTVKKVRDDLYFGISCSNLMDVNGLHGSIFASRIPNSINLSDKNTFIDNLKGNSSVIGGFNMLRIQELPNANSNTNTNAGFYPSPFVKWLMPFSTKFGVTTVGLGTSLNLTKFEKSNLSLSAKHVFDEYGVSLVGTIDTVPIQKKVEDAIIGLEYDRPTRFGEIGFGLYLQATHKNDAYKFSPRFGLKMEI